MIDPRLVDHAKSILENADIPLESKSTLWEHFHSVRSSSELASKLASFSVDDAVKQALVNAKKLNDPEREPTNPVVDGLSRLKKLDPEVLDLSEKHPSIIRSLIDVAMREK
jgi:hypothetical protein